MQNLEDNNHDKVEAVDLQVEMARSYLDYAMSVIVAAHCLISVMV